MTKTLLFSKVDYINHMLLHCYQIGLALNIEFAHIIAGKGR